MKTPTVFISYAHEEPEHDQWVLHFASDLRINGVEASLDVWDLVAGQDTTFFIESQIRNSDFVILIITPLYTKKSNLPSGGVGYEKNIISAEMLQASDLHPKFIPILRKGDFKDLPTFLGSKFALDFREEVDQEKALFDLIRTIFQQPHPQKPPLGKAPFDIEDKTLIIKPALDRTAAESKPEKSDFDPVNSRNIETWEKEATGRFDFLRSSRISKSKKDPFTEGFWQASFILSSEFPSKSLTDLLTVLKASPTHRTGWDIGWVPTRMEIAPYPYKGGIEVWLAEDGDKDPGHSDFWRAELNGRFALFRGYQEDGGDFKNIAAKKLLDYSLVLWRVSEFLLYLESFAEQLKLSDASATVKFHWRGLEKRKIWNHKDPMRAFLYETEICLQNDIESKISISSYRGIKKDLIDNVHIITRPLFEAFNFFSIEKLQIKKIIKDLFDPDKEIKKI